MILNGTRVVASLPPLGGSLAGALGQARTVSVGGDRYRAIVAPALADGPSVRFALLRPQSLIDAANAGSRNRLLLGLLVCIGFVSLVAYFEGRSIVRTLRALAEAAHGIARGRLSERVPVHGRDEFALLGTAFNEMANQLEARLAELEASAAASATRSAASARRFLRRHDVEQLMRVIVETAVETTGSTGARLFADDGRVVESGEPDSDGIVLELPLSAGRTTFGTLFLVGPSFDAEQRLNAVTLASHSAIALENARLHRIVERQALVDGLTGLANRRQCDDSLSAEIARAQRLDIPFTLVLADLDDFKAVNDRHGHAVGDDVLRSSRPCSARPSATPTSPAAGAGRSSCSSCPAPTRPARSTSPSASGRRSQSARSTAAPARPSPSPAASGWPSTGRAATVASFSRRPIGPCTGQRGRAETGSNWMQVSGAFSSLERESP